ncbi:hypothetical protein NIES208_10585 [[Limnothrix rosea] IAM M-220]|nr:hypothetical protein NIES208_10585 [[Limnothrix rosea] IAM M-220]
MVVNRLNYIISNPEVLSGKPLVRGTRLSVEFLSGLSKQDWSEAEILENYPSLTTESIRAVLKALQLRQRPFPKK